MQTVLVIDDDEIHRELFSLLLTDEGYRVVTAPDGLQGLALYKHQRPTLVFLDLSLPDTNGLEILRAIRRFDERARVIVITGYGSVESAVAAMQSGAVDFVEKVDLVGNFREAMSRKIRLVLDEMSREHGV